MAMKVDVSLMPMDEERQSLSIEPHEYSGIDLSELPGIIESCLKSDIEYGENVVLYNIGVIFPDREGN